MVENETLRYLVSELIPRKREYVSNKIEALVKALAIAGHPVRYLTNLRVQSGKTVYELIFDGDQTLRVPETSLSAPTDFLVSRFFKVQERKRKCLREQRIYERGQEIAYHKREMVSFCNERGLHVPKDELRKFSADKINDPEQLRNLFAHLKDEIGNYIEALKSKPVVISKGEMSRKTEAILNGKLTGEVGIVTFFKRNGTYDVNITPLVNSVFDIYSATEDVQPGFEDLEDKIPQQMRAELMHKENFW